jgi:hypothetical protein
VSITENPNGAEFPRDGWRRAGRKIDLLATYGECGHCDVCGTSIRYAFSLRHDDWPESVHVGSECRRRLTIRWRQNRNRNYVARIGRYPLTVFGNAMGFWQIVFRDRFSGFFASSAEAMAVAFAFATGGA